MARLRVLTVAVMTPASLVLDLVERVWNGGDLDALARFYADPFEHDGGTGTVAELREWHRDDATTWAGTSYAVLDCVAADDSVALRWRATSTHVGRGGRSRPPAAGSSGPARTSSGSRAAGSWRCTRSPTGSARPMQLGRPDDAAADLPRDGGSDDWRPRRDSNPRPPP